MVNVESEKIGSKEHLSHDFTQGYPLPVEEMMRVGHVIRKRTKEEYKHRERRSS